MKIQDLQEGLYDKHIFKAIFMAGAPGSGKSTISKKLLDHTGFREVNIDKFIELLAKKDGLDLKDMDSWQGDQISRSEKLSRNQYDIYLNGRLPILVDGTGRNYEKITSVAENLSSQYGYECGLVFVNVSLETAMARNAARERSVNPEYLETAWRETQYNIGKFQDYFGSDMFIIDNNDKADLTKVSKRLGSFINSPVRNPLASKWVSKEKEKRNITS